MYSLSLRCSAPVDPAIEVRPGQVDVQDIFAGLAAAMDAVFDLVAGIGRIAVFKEDHSAAPVFFSRSSE